MKKLIATAFMTIAVVVMGPVARSETTLIADNSPPAYAQHGPGMMGSYGMGPGMMGAYGAGPGMMGSYGMGPGMTGYALRADLNLTKEQRGKIAKIESDTRRKHWEMMEKIYEEQSQMNDLNGSDQRNDAAISKSYRRILDLRQQMFDISLTAQRQIDAVLTTEQREK
jgi:Spy/CpxP family protein refolding chaperone